MLSVLIFFSGVHVGQINGGWHGILLCGVFSFLMASIHDEFFYLGSRCVYEIKQRDPKSAEKVSKFLAIITLPLFIIMLIATILASIKLCEVVCDASKDIGVAHSGHVTLGACLEIGATTGFIPGRPKIQGVNAGRGSNLQVFRQMVKKFDNGTVGVGVASIHLTFRFFSCCVRLCISSLYPIILGVTLRGEGVKCQMLKADPYLLRKGASK